MDLSLGLLCVGPDESVARFVQLILHLIFHLNGEIGLEMAFGS